ncbi:thermonuclease family protein [Xanthomarina spongicola]|uniref:Endonuclease YncB(Thermonuclease family) n=1 Tax=Xanthomarina spongicola TaxID=570520 RepID=A0A316DMZ5_9FLAO|nr:thermonuclease family protein [Xanthomarina spongicola]PWK18569.1 endonuclease YncB(thermonuclease family) [Xanthomarina spongicola]
MNRVKHLVLFFILVSNIVFAHKTILKDTIINGKVVGITDGDTFKLLTQDSTLLIVRLANIDCPERKQPFSIKAKEFVSQAIFNKEVTIKVLKKDRYRRLISVVYYNDNLNLNQELLKAGLAWHYLKYSNDTTLQMLEDQAKKNKVGLWQDPTAIAPWEWRNKKKKKSK